MKRVKDMITKARVTLSIDEHVVDATKKSIGMVPLSRFVEQLLRKELTGAGETGAGH